jgi:hypothetical protein
LLASLDPEERQAVLAALAKKKRKAEKEARLEQAQVRRAACRKLLYGCCACRKGLW